MSSRNSPRTRRLSPGGGVKLETRCPRTEDARLADSASCRGACQFHGTSCIRNPAMASPRPCQPGAPCSRLNVALAAISFSPFTENEILCIETLCRRGDLYADRDRLPAAAYRLDKNLRMSLPEDLIVIMICCAELMFGSSCAPKATFRIAESAQFTTSASNPANLILHILAL